MKQSQLLDKFNLPYYLKGKSFSDASRAIERKFKDRNDIISLNTKKELLERLKMAQEHTKQPNQTPNSFAGGGQIENLSEAEGKFGFNPQLQREYELGESLTDTAAGAFGIFGAAARGIMKGGQLLEGSDNKQVSKTGAILGGFTNPISASMGVMRNPDATFKDKVATFASTGLLGGLYGKKLEDKSRNKLDFQETSRTLSANTNVYNKGGLANGPCGGAGQPPCPKLSAANLKEINKDTNIDFTEEGANKLFRPKDTITPTGVNLGKYGKAGYFKIDPSDPTGTTVSRGDRFNQNREAYDMYINSVKELNPSTKLAFNPFKMGGSPNSYEGGGRPRATGLDYIAPSSGITGGEFGYDSGKMNPLLFSKGQYKKPPIDFQNIGNIAGSIGAGLGRAAPLAMDAYQLFSNKEADPVRLDRMDKRYKPQYADEASAMNTINADTGNLNRAISNASNGSTGALRSNLLAAHFNKTRAVSNEYNKIAAINRNQDDIAQRFDFRSDSLNLRQANLEQDINDRNEGAYNTARSTLLGNMGTTAGDIGLEGQRMQYARKMGLMYDSNGKYIGRVDKATGKWIPAEK